MSLTLYCITLSKGKQRHSGQPERPKDACHRTNPPDVAQAAAQHLLQAHKLPAGIRTLLAYLLTIEGDAPTIPAMADEMGRCDRTVSVWARQAKQAGLLTVVREGRRNRYQVNHEQLQRLAKRSGL